MLGPENAVGRLGALLNLPDDFFCVALDISAAKSFSPIAAHKGSNTVFHSLGGVRGCHPTHRRGTQALTGTETGLPPFSLWFCTRITAIGRDRPTGKSASAFQFPETFGKHCFVPESFSLIPAAQIFPDCPNCSQCLYLFQKFYSLPCFIATCICSTPDMLFRYFFQGIVLCVA